MTPHKLLRRNLLQGLAALPISLARGASADVQLLKGVSGGTDAAVAVPGDSLYEVWRRDIWSALVPDRFPAAIVKALSARDVQAAIRFANANDLPIAIRGGGHNWSAASIRDDAVLVDLGQLRGLKIDPVRRTAYVQPGISGGALLHAARLEGLAFPIAHCPSVPMSGFLLNGGFGFNSNAWGVAAAHILDMDIVVASGELVRASPDENADLYWSARGSGPGFFGAVVGFTLNLLPDPEAIVSTNYIFPLSAAADVAAWAEELRDAAGTRVEFTYLTSATGGPPSEPGLCVLGGIAFADSEEQARSDLAFLKDSPLQRSALMVQDEIATPWETLLPAVAALFPPGLHYLGNTIWSDDPITDYYPGYATLLEKPSSPHNFSNCVFYPVDKADAPPLPDAAVSMQRKTLCLYYAIWDDPAHSADNQAWFGKASDVFLPHAIGNYIGEADLNLYPNEAEGSYGQEAWLKMQSIREKWDPHGRFPHFLGQQT